MGARHVADGGEIQQMQQSKQRHDALEGGSFLRGGITKRARVDAAFGGCCDKAEGTYRMRWASAID